MTAAPRFLRSIDVEVLYGIPRSTQYHYIKTNPAFPKPFKISPRCVRFKADEIETFLASTRSAAPANAA